MGRRLFRFVYLAFACAASGCGAAGPEPTDVVVRDSVGVRIVEHAANASPPVRWTLDLTEGLAYDMPEGEAPLFRASRALRLSDGRVVVADAGNNRLVLFAADGSLLSTSGREGDGPGEFRRIGLLGVWVADSLVVWDDRSRRVSVMTPDAVFERSFSLTLPQGVPFARVLGVYPGGSFLGMSFTNMGQPPEAGLQRTPIRLHHFSTDGSHLATLGEASGTEVYYTIDGSGQVALYPPHFFRSGTHLASDRLLLTENDSWELRFLSPDGDIQQIVRWAKPLQLVTDDDLAASLDVLMSRTPEARQAATRAVASELNVHATMPAFDEVFYDRLGRVWLQSYDPSGGDLVEWTIFGPGGALLASATLPRELRLSDAGPDWALVRVLDDLDVERLLLVPITQAEENGAS